MNYKLLFCIAIILLAVSLCFGVYEFGKSEKKIEHYEMNYRIAVRSTLSDLEMVSNILDEIVLLNDSTEKMTKYYTLKTMFGKRGVNYEHYSFLLTNRIINSSDSVYSRIRGKVNIAYRNICDFTSSYNNITKASETEINRLKINYEVLYDQLLNLYKLPPFSKIR